MNSYVCFLAMLAGIKKRIAHHHQAYGNNLICSLMRIPCKLFATHWLACGEAAAINGWGRSAFKKGKVTILPNAIDPERFKFNETARREIRKRYGIADNDFVVGHVGRFFPEKNHKFIIALFSEYSQNHNFCKLLLVGNGPLQAGIQDLVKLYKLESRVVFAGLQKDVLGFYCAMDVLVLPSTREAFPMTLVEAQYNGLPCIVSDVVPREVEISNGVNRLNLSDSTQKWVNALSLLSRKRHCIKCTKSQFDIDKTYPQLQMVYMEQTWF